MRKSENGKEKWCRNQRRSATISSNIRKIIENLPDYPFSDQEHLLKGIKWIETFEKFTLGGVNYVQSIGSVLPWNNCRYAAEVLTDSAYGFIKLSE